MPSGKNHDIISIVFLPFLMAGLYFFSLPTISIILITIGYLFASFMFNGDLDIHSRPYNRWLFLKWYWIPYRNMIPHRSILSHGIIIGTIIRLIYISPLLFLSMYLLKFSIFVPGFFIFCIGLEIGSALHTICDKLF